VFFVKTKKIHRAASIIRRTVQNEAKKRLHRSMHVFNSTINIPW